MKLRDFVKLSSVGAGWFLLILATERSDAVERPKHTPRSSIVAPAALVDATPPMIDRSGDLLNRILRDMNVAPPSVAPPRPPTFVFDSLQIDEILRTYKPGAYRISRLVNTGNCDVTLSTPVTEVWDAHRKQRRAKDRPTRHFYNGDRVVTLTFTPKTRQVTDLGLAPSSERPWEAHCEEFTSSVLAVRALRDSILIDDLQVSFKGVSVDRAPLFGTDDASMAIVQIPFEWFDGADGRLPEIRIELTGARKGFWSGRLEPDKPKVFKLPKVIVERIATDIRRCHRADETEPRAAE